MQDPTAPADLRKELDFYSAVKDQSVDENFSPRPSGKEKAKRSPAAVQGSIEPLPAPRPAPGDCFMLQVAALRKRAECQSPGRRATGQGIPRGGRVSVEVRKPAVDPGQGWTVSQHPGNIPSEGPPGPGRL